MTGTLDTDMKRYDLMSQVNARGTFLVGKCCIPYLKKSANPHILTLSPPLDMKAKWFAPHVAYTTAKFGMSLCTLAWAEEFRKDGIAANSLWPRTTIATAAVAMLGGEALLRRSRSAEIMADAAHAILTRPSRVFTGNFCIDDAVLWDAGVRDFAKYAAVPGTPESGLQIDFFVPEDGQVTFYGPGQLVAYVLLDLHRAGYGVKELVRRLEQSVIDLLAGYGIRGERRAGMPGVYVAGAKIAAVGLRVSRGSSYHGIALNVDLDLEPFSRIDPCGYPGLAVTRLRDLGVTLDVGAAGERFAGRLARALGLRLGEAAGAWRRGAYTPVTADTGAPVSDP